MAVLCHGKRLPQYLRSAPFRVGLDPAIRALRLPSLHILVWIDNAERFSYLLPTTAAAHV